MKSKYMIQCVASRSSRFLPLLLAVVCPMEAAAGAYQDAGSTETISVIEGARVALVVGNNHYKHAGSLSQAREDAKTIATALRRDGFSVEARYDLNHDSLVHAIEDLGTRARSAEVAFFYYAGHALQIDGRNYLVPTDADLPSGGYVKSRAVDVDEVMLSMEQAGTKLNVVVLDACRNNPFAPRWPSPDRDASRDLGLAQLTKAPSEFIIAYATSPGMVASDSGAYANATIPGEVA